MRISSATQCGEIGFAKGSRALAAAVLVAASAMTSGAEEAPLALVFETPHAQFGERYQHETVVHRFQVENPGDRAVRIVSVVPRSEDGWVEGVPVDLAPGGHSELIVHLPLAERLGRTAVRVGVYTNERSGFDVSPGTAHYKLSLSGFVQSAYDPERLVVSLGLVDVSSGGRTVVELASREVRTLSIRGTREAGPGVTVRDVGAVGLPGEGRRIEVALAPGSSLGLHEGRVVLETNVVNQPLMVLRYQANVFADVVPDRNPIKLSGGRVDETVTEVLELRSRTETAFEIVAVGDPDGRFELLRDDPCPGSAKACRRLTLQIRPTVSGPMEGTLAIRIHGQPTPLPIVYRGWVLPADAVIQTIDAVTTTDGEVDDG